MPCKQSSYRHEDISARRVRNTRNSLALNLTDSAVQVVHDSVGQWKKLDYIPFFYIRSFL